MINPKLYFLILNSFIHLDPETCLIEIKVTIQTKGLFKWMSSVSKARVGCYGVSAMASLYKVVFIRHGESVYNQENRFCGWHDADLSPKGEQEARSAGQMIKEKGLSFDVAYTSVLKRAIKTLNAVLEVNDLHWIPVHKYAAILSLTLDLILLTLTSHTFRSWRLNERMYGGLQGLNKSETAAKHGESQVKIWRRAYDIPPPALEISDDRWPGKEEKYKVRFYVNSFIEYF